MRIVEIRCPSCGAKVSSETMKCEYCGANLLLVRDDSTGTDSINWNKVWDLVYERLKCGGYTFLNIKEAVWKVLGEYREVSWDLWEYQATKWAREGKLREVFMPSLQKTFYNIIWRCEKCGWGEVKLIRERLTCESCGAIYPSPKRNNE